MTQSPAPPSMRLVFRTLWLLVVGSWETFVWGNIRAGSVSIAGTPRSFRLLIRVALWLTIGLVVALLFAEAWRQLSPLVPMLFYTDSLSGLYAPQVLVPLTIGLLTLAWAYLIGGALHAPWWAKLVVLLLLVVFDLSFSLQLISSLPEVFGLLDVTAADALWVLLALLAHTASWIVLLGLFALRWRSPARPGFEFPALLAVLTLLFFSSYYGTLAGSQAFQSTTTATALQLTNTLDAISIFLMPFLLLSGAGVAGFGMNLTGDLTRQLADHRAAESKWTRRLWLGFLAAFLIWRVSTLWIGPLFNRSLVPPGVGALLAAACGGLLYLVLRRRPAPGQLPGWVVPSAAILLYGLLFVVQLIGSAEALIAAVLITSGLSTARLQAVFNSLFAFIARDNEVFVAGLVFVFGVALWLHARLRRRPLPAAALFAWIFSGWLLFWVLTRHGQFLGRLSFQYRDLETILAPLLLLALLLASLTRRLSPRALLHLTAAAILLWLLESQSWLSDPLSPVFGLLGAQSFFISASIFLNVMQAGEQFALNDELPGFPRQSRAQLYFGYALLTVITVNWLAVSHNAPAIAQQSQIAANGFIAIGLPLAFWALLTASPDLLGQVPE